MSNAFWHGFADMHAISEAGPLVITRGEGSWVWDQDGKRYFDAAGALWYMNVGHGRRRIAEAMMAQSALIASYSSFGECTTATTIELANRVAGLAPNPDSKVFFTLGGSDAIDTAIKMARRYWTLREQPRKQIRAREQRRPEYQRIIGVARERRLIHHHKRSPIIHYAILTA